jgi:hypothetical protein
MSERASDTQIGGDHYKGMLIQPAVFCEHNKLSHLESNVVKRMCRWRTKGVALKDLRKAQHEIELLIEIHGVEDWPSEENEAKRAEDFRERNLHACAKHWGEGFNDKCDKCQGLLHAAATKVEP